MNCPKCYNSEISPSGFCLVCGYRLEAPAREIDNRPINSPESEADIPQWRKELSERLKSIKQKSQMDEKDASPEVIVPVEPADVPPSQAGNEIVRKQPPKKQQTPSHPILQTPPPKQKKLAPLRPAKNPKDVEQIIDKAVSARISKSPQTQLSMPEIWVPSPEQPVFYEDKLILLSRTLAGLVDLMFVVLCTVIFIIASDIFSGIVSLDPISYWIFAALFLSIYLLYSIFFLAASTQTIGMMITDLRLVGKSGRRPFFRQVLCRCLGYLLSLFIFGIGLVLSLFDSENRCFHDRISNTQVIRI